jgi:hypothetical protein
MALDICDDNWTILVCLFEDARRNPDLQISFRIYANASNSAKYSDTNFPPWTSSPLYLRNKPTYYPEGVIRFIEHYPHAVPRIDLYCTGTVVDGWSSILSLDDAIGLACTFRDQLINGGHTATRFAIHATRDELPAGRPIENELEMRCCSYLGSHVTENTGVTFSFEFNADKTIRAFTVEPVPS